MFKMKLSGKVLKFGNDVNTDVILPGKYLTITDPYELGTHAMEGLDPDFTSKSAEGVIVVAGKNFGCGSSREQAPTALKYSNVKCVIAESFARIFFRNAINIGLPVLECPEISRRVNEGEFIEVYLEEGIVKVPERSLTFQASKLPSFILDIIREGGLIQFLKRQHGNE